MKDSFPPLLRAYREGLGRYLEDVSDFNLQEAHKLNERALALGLETLDLAKLHEEALIVLTGDAASDDKRDQMIRRARIFFAKTFPPIEANQRVAREADSKLDSTLEQLRKRTQELDAANSALTAEIKKRELVESSLQISESATSELLAESLSLQEELRNLSRRLLDAHEDERKRISRELHDIVVQTLTGINVRLATLTLQTEANSKGIQRKIAATQRQVEKSVEIVHRFARDLRPTVLDDLGLIPALESYLKDFMKESGIRATLTVFAGVEYLGSAVRTVLYRVVQEALSNVAHHSEATMATVSIQELKDLVRMEIHDDGKGFNLVKPGGAQSCQRLGLLGMRERVEMIGGQFLVESEPGKETTIRVDIPRSHANRSSGR